MLTEKELTDLLRANGHKVTPQRVRIYEVLAQTKVHPTAETIYKTVHPRYPEISLATVYKSLDIFAKLCIIKALNTGEDSFRYDADTSDHQHIQCTCCGRVDDLTMENTAILGIVEKESGYRVQGNEMYFYGVCPECRRKQSN